VEALGHVVNFDVPTVPEDYIHRVGRTARAEATGTALTLVAPEDEDDVRRIERALGAKLARVRLEGFAYDAPAAPPLELTSRERAAARHASRKGGAPAARHAPRKGVPSVAGSSRRGGGAGQAGHARSNQKARSAQNAQSAQHARPTQNGRPTPTAQPTQTSGRPTADATPAAPAGLGPRRGRNTRRRA